MTRVETIQFEELTEVNETPGGALIKRDLSTLGHVVVQLEVVVGEATTTVGELFKLASGSTLELDTELDALLDLRLNGKTFARGHLVAVDDNFGIKIVEIA